MMPDFIFSDWAAIGRTLAAGICGYVVLIFVLRVSGKRTLSKMNAFDLVITITFGSTFASLMLSRDISLAEGLAALALLALLQYIVARLSVASEAFSGLVKS